MTPFLETLLAEAYNEDSESLDLVQDQSPGRELVFLVGPRATTDGTAVKSVKKALIQRPRD